MLTKKQANYINSLMSNLKQTKVIKETREKLSAFTLRNSFYFPDEAELEFFNSLILERMQVYSGKDPRWFSFCMETHENIANALYRIKQCKKEDLSILKNNK